MFHDLAGKVRSIYWWTIIRNGKDYLKLPIIGKRKGRKEQNSIYPQSGLS
jgi:hypothetical protein